MRGEKNRITQKLQTPTQPKEKFTHTRRKKGEDDEEVDEEVDEEGEDEGDEEGSEGDEEGDEGDGEVDVQAEERRRWK